MTGKLRFKDTTSTFIGVGDNMQDFMAAKAAKTRPSWNLS